MENRTYENGEVEIDVLELLLEFKRRIWVILAAAVFTGAAAWAFSVFVMTPQYTSTAMVYILSKETTLTSLADLQIGSQLTKDYKIIVTSRPVLEEVIESLKMDISYEDMVKKITIDNPADTRILSITAEDPDPVRAKTITDKIAATASDYIGDIMEMIPPKLIEGGQVSDEPSSPDNIQNTIIGAIFGLLLACGMIAMQVVLNDTVRTEEDVSKYLGLSVLASVPLREGEAPEDKEAMISYKGKPNQRSAQRQSRRKKKGGMES